MRWPNRLAASAIGAGALLLTACSEQAPDTPAAAPATSLASTEIVVVENEYGIELPEQQLTPGTYTFTARNHGDAPHDLVIQGPGVDAARTEVIRPGREDSIVVTFEKGEYVLWCSVRDHRDRGMEKKITVN